MTTLPVPVKLIYILFGKWGIINTRGRSCLKSKSKTQSIINETSTWWSPGVSSQTREIGISKKQREPDHHKPPKIHSTSQK